MRGGQKMIDQLVRPAPEARVVWITGGGIT